MTRDCRSCEARHMYSDMFVPGLSLANSVGLSADDSLSNRYSRSSRSSARPFPPAQEKQNPSSADRSLLMQAIM